MPMLEVRVPDTSIENLAAGYYIDLPYHNFKHALKVARVGMEISSRCLQEGIQINPTVVYYALLFHDAGYHEDCKQKGFTTKEEYSAFLAGDALIKSGVENNLIVLVKKAIISTTRDSPFTTNEEKTVRAADLAELAGDYGQFMDNNKRLKQEAELLGGKKISWEEWKKMSKEIIEFYLKQDIRLTSFYEGPNGESVFHTETRKNLERFLSESSENS